jgi:hypothetical protein
MDLDGFDELEKQEPYTRAFLTESIRRNAYPFTNGLPAASNVVTLLAWAYFLGVVPAQPNRFFEAKAAGRLDRVETDERRTLSFSLFWPGRILSGGGTLLSVVAAVTVVSTDWHVLLRPFGWWSPLISLAVAAVPFVITLGLSAWAGGRPEGSWPKVYLTTGADSEDALAHIFFAASPVSGMVAWCVFVGGPVAYAMAIAPVVAFSLPAYLAMAILGPIILFYLPVLDLCGPNARFYLYRPNRYIDMYDDPRSRNWLRPATVQRIAEPAEANLLRTR